MFKLGRQTGEPRRMARREQALCPATITFEAPSRDRLRVVNCILWDLSDTGAKIAIPLDVVVPREFDFAVPTKGLKCRALMQWRRGEKAGLLFLPPQP